MLTYETCCTLNSKRVRNGVKELDYNSKTIRDTANIITDLQSASKIDSEQCICISDDFMSYFLSTSVII